MKECQGLHKCNRYADPDAIVCYACPGIPCISVVDHQCQYAEANPDGTLQDMGDEVEER